MSRTIYVSGPMRGYERFNFDLFLEAAKKLRELGLEVICPAEHDLEGGFDPDMPDSAITEDMIAEFLSWDLAMVAKCDAIALLPGWEDSDGANKEFSVAKWCGKEIYLYEPNNPDLLRLYRCACGCSGSEPATDPIKAITDERGKNYGHPFDQFPCVEGMFEHWTHRRTDTEYGLDGYGVQSMERCLRHSVYMILLKLSRIAENPRHIDNWDDIQGYAECFKMCVERHDGVSG